MDTNTNASEDKPVETLVGGRYLEMEQDGDAKSTVKSRLSGLLWHGGSAYDAWFSCASNQVHISSIYSLYSHLFYFHLISSQLKTCFSFVCSSFLGFV